MVLHHYWLLVFKNNQHRDDTQYGETSWTQKPQGALIVVPLSLLFGRLLESRLVSKLAWQEKAAEIHQYMCWNYLGPFCLKPSGGGKSKSGESWHKIIDPLYNFQKLMSMIATIYSHETKGMLLSPPLQSSVKQKCGPYGSVISIWGSHLMMCHKGFKGIVPHCWRRTFLWSLRVKLQTPVLSCNTCNLINHNSAVFAPALSYSSHIYWLARHWMAHNSTRIFISIGVFVRHKQGSTTVKLLKVFEVKWNSSEVEYGGQVGSSHITFFSEVDMYK